MHLFWPFNKKFPVCTSHSHGRGDFHANYSSNLANCKFPLLQKSCCIILSYSHIYSIHISIALSTLWLGRWGGRWTEEGVLEVKVHKRLEWHFSSLLCSVNDCHDSPNLQRNALTIPECQLIHHIIYSPLLNLISVSKTPISASRSTL